MKVILPNGGTAQSGKSIVVIGGAPYVLQAVANDALYMRLSGTTASWGFDASYFYGTSCKIGMIGDSQGVGLGETTGNKPYDILHARYPKATITNYCVSGQNSRTIIPSGTYVNSSGNIIKAMTDGNRVVIVFDTSNDSYSGGAGGVVPLSEWEINIQLIHDTFMNNAGVGQLIIFVSTIPRGDLTTAGKQQQQDMRDWYVKTFGNRIAMCWWQVVDPATGNTLKSAYDYGDTIHLNDAGGLIMTSAVVDALDYFFSKWPSKITKYEIYRSADAVTFTLDSTQYGNSVTVAPGYFYRTRAYFQDGTIIESNNTPYVTVVASANAGTDQSLPSGTTTFTLTGSGTPSTGNTITTYLWTRVSGPNTPSITSPGAATTGVTGAIAGIYVFNLHVADSGGFTADDTVQITIAAPATLKSAKYKFAFTSAGATAVALFNDVLGGGLDATNYSKTWADTAGGTTVVLQHLVTSSATALQQWGTNYTQNNSGNNNGETSVDDGGGWPIGKPAVQSGFWAFGPTAPSGQFRFTGLAASKPHTIKIYGSLSSSFSTLKASPMLATVVGFTAVSFNANGNTSHFATFVNVMSDASGNSPAFFVSPGSGQDFGLLNAVTIDQTA